MNNPTRTNVNRFKAYLKELFPGLVPLFLLAHFMHHVPGFIIQPVLPSIQDRFKLDYFSIGGLMAAYNLAYGASQLPAGWLGDRIAPRILITAGVAGVAFFGLLAGLAPTYLMLVFALLLMGIFGGGYHPSAAPVLSDTTPVEKRGRVLGIHQIGGTAANFLTPLFVTIIAVFASWRGSFIVLSIPIFAYGIYLYYLLKRRRLGDRPHPVETESFSIRINPRGYLRRIVAFVAMGTAVQVFIFSVLSFIPLLVVREYGGSEQLGAALLALGHLGGLWSGPIGGHISDRIGKVPVMLTISLAAGPIIYLLSLGTYWWLLPILLLLMGTVRYVAMPVAEAYVISNTSQHNRSTALGIYYFIAQGGAGFVSPVIGKLIDQYSFSVAFASIGAGLFVVVLVCSLFLWGHKD